MKRIVDMKKVVALMFLLSMPAAVLSAHDLWLSALPQELVRPGEVLLTLSVGERLDVHELMKAGDGRETTSFEIVSREGVRDLRDDFHWEKPAVLALSAGTHVVSMQRPPSKITLDLGTARHYLEEEHHGHLFDQMPPDTTSIRERFSRHLKTIIQVGSEVDATWGTTLGQKLEIVPVDNPLTAGVGDSIRVRLLLEDVPLENAPIYIYGRVGEDVRSDFAYTDRHGIAALKIPASGSVLIRTVHVRPVQGDELMDLESFWAALTFAVQ